MPVSLFTATVFSEALWQRVWASESKKALRNGAIIGCIFVVLIVFFAGFCGLLAAWAGLITTDTNYNLYLFQVLHGGQIPPIPTVSNWIGVICVVLAAVMNEGAVDSIQNGMASAITSYLVHFYKSWTLLKTRLVVLVLNCGLIGIAVWLTLGTVKVGVLELFLMANMLACSSAVPVLVGLSERLYMYYHGASFLFSCLFSIFCTCGTSLLLLYHSYICIATKFIHLHLPHLPFIGSHICVYLSNIKTHVVRPMYQDNNKKISCMYYIWMQSLESTITTPTSQMDSQILTTLIEFTILGRLIQPCSIRGLAMDTCGNFS